MATLAARRVEESSEARFRCSDEAVIEVAKPVRSATAGDAQHDDGDEDLDEGVAVVGERSRADVEFPSCQR